MSSALPKVCIIGAGSSGITAVKALADRGIPFDCFEASDEVGGNWVYRNKNGMSAAYASLHINTDSVLMSYADYPMPEGTPDYPSHAVIKAYFDDYLDHFSLRERITFNTRVEKVVRETQGIYRVTTSDGRTRSYDALMVANGHHWDPLWPQPYPGQEVFQGQIMHSHEYLTPNDPVDCQDKNVLVVGMGNSAMDIACELCRPGLAKNLYLSARHGVHILPKYLGSMPITKITRASKGWEPEWLTRWVLGILLRIFVGKPSDYGLQQPDHQLLHAHPTVSHDIFVRLGSGDIKPRKGIKEIKANSVVFTDGTEDAVDVIVYCTGYKVSFPFFDANFLSAPNNDLPLWQRMMRPEIPDLMFLGLCQPLGAIMPLAELQAKFFADYLLGRIALPDRQRMEREMAQEREVMFKRYTDRAARHTMQVDAPHYSAMLKRLRKAGERRAQTLGGQLPVPAVAAEEAAEAA